MTNTFEKANIISAAIKEAEAMVVHSRFQMEALRDVFNKKGDGVAMTNLIVGKEGNVEISVLRVPCNLGTEVMRKERSFVMTSNNSARMIERFTKDTINIVIEANEYASLVSSTIYRIGEGLNEKFYTETEIAGKVYELVSKEEAPASVVLDAAGNPLPGVRTYGGERGGQISSASQLRKLSITMAENSDPEEVRRRQSLVDYGSFDMIHGTLTTMSGLVKYSARVGQSQAPVCMTKELVGTIAIAPKWKNKAGNEYNDGSAYVSSDFAAKACTESTDSKFVVKERAVLGMVFQCRPWKAKVMARCVDQAYINELIAFRGYEVVRIDRNNVSELEQNEFNKLFVKGGNSAFADKLVIVYDDINAPIDFYTDLNGMKATYDLTRTSGFNVLDIGNVQPDVSAGAATSMQMLQSLLYFNYEAAMKYISERGQAHLAKNLDRLLSEEAQVPGVGEFSKLYAAGTIPKVARDFTLRRNSSLYKSQVNNFMKGMSGAIESLKFDLPGTTGKIVPDFAMDFEQMALGVAADGKVEVFCTAAEQYFTELGLPEETWIISGYKYPKMHVQEVLIARVVSMKEIGARIDALEITSKQKNLLRRQYKALSRAVVVVPAIELLKNMLAGMDFDADAAILVFDIKFNRILVESNRKPVAVVIEDDYDAAEEQVEVKADMAWTVLSRFAGNKNKSIGEFTVMNDLVIALLLLVQLGYVEEAQKIMSLAFEGEHVIDTYKSPIKEEVGEFGIPVIPVSDTLMRDIVAKICDMSLSKENMVAALYDLVAVGRMLQEVTIDSAKTNRILEALYDLNAVANSKSRSPLAIEIKWNGDSVTLKNDDELAAGFMEDRGVRFNLDKDKSGFVGEGKKRRFSLNESFHELRKIIARILFRNALDLRAAKHEFTNEQMAMLKRIEARFPEERAMVIEAKMIYDDLTGIMRKEVKGKDSEELRAIKDDFNLNIEALSNHVRRITKGMTAIERAMLLTIVGGDSAFAFSVCQEEYMHMVLAHFAEIDFAGEKLIKCTFEAGSVVTFVGGTANVDGKIAVTKTDLTGEFEIREHNGRMFAAKQIAELVNIPAIDESVTMVKTKNLSITAMKEVTAKVTSGKAVKLQTVGGDNIVVDGEAACKFCCNDNKLKNKILSKMYRGATGTVERLVAGSSRGNDGKQHHVAIMVLRDTVVVAPTEAEVAAATKAAAEARVIAREAAAEETKVYGAGVDFSKSANTAF